MSEPEEIEVEVIEVVESRPASHPDRPNTRPNTEPDGTSRGGFNSRFTMSTRRIPAYLWPLIFVFGLIFAALFVVIALVLLIVVGIPFLIIRTITRLLMGPSR